MGRLRSRHDAILVGIGTALNDNPQLNSEILYDFGIESLSAYALKPARLLSPDDGGKNIPLPIVLDAQLRFRPESKLCANYKADSGRQPTVFTALSNVGDVEWARRRDVLEENGVKVIAIPSISGMDLFPIHKNTQMATFSHRDFGSQRDAVHPRRHADTVLDG